MPVRDRLALVERGRSDIPLSHQLALLQLNRSWYYEWEKRLDLPPDPKDVLLMHLIDKWYTKCPYFGVRRITEHIRAHEGVLVNHKRVARLMEVMGICAIYQKQQLSKPQPGHEIYPYLLGGVHITHPNQVHGVDITYIRLRGGFLYLVAVIDWFSRYVLSWELSDSLTSGFCVMALQNALKIGVPEIHNSDRGSQFTSDGYLKVLKANQAIRISMDHRGRCFDNIFTERLWRTVKYEEVYLKDYTCPRQASQSLQEYFTFYNHERLHQALGYQTPASIYFNSKEVNVS